MVTRRRPTASDHNLAEYIYDLAPGTHEIFVEDLSVQAGTGPLRYLGLARLKTEGSLTIELGAKLIRIIWRKAN
jgi:hypothetical protein